MANNSLDIALLNNDLYFINGDFVVSISDEQHVMDTIGAFPGWWKENAPDGVGIIGYENASGIEQELQRSIQLQLKSDGYSSSPKAVVDPNGLLNVYPNAQKL